MSISPHHWEKSLTCIGMYGEKKGIPYRTGCGKQFTATFFDLYRVKHWLSAALSMGSDFDVLTNCPHCGQPNNIQFSYKLQSEKDSDTSDLSNVDRRFVDKLPFKFTRFFSKF